MSWYASPDDEARSLRRAAARAGCIVRELVIRETSVGPHAVGRVTCNDGWGAARMLVALGVEDSRTPGARDLALALRRRAPSDEAFGRAVQEYVKERVAFVKEAGEVFQGSAYTLASGAGDCDDHARPVYALALAGGLPTAMAFLHHGGARAQPTHAVAQLRGAWAETTIDADFGEHPLDAAIRLGLVDARQDLAREVRIMTEKDLPPPPPRYATANPAELVTRDAQALERLGLCAGDSTDARDPTFRAAVASFQRTVGGLTIDGLIGPKTRAALARALPRDEFGIGYLASVDASSARILSARETLSLALDVLGIEASSEGREALLSIAWGETRFGDPANGWADSNNWGGVTFNPKRGEPFVTWGALEHGDRDANGNPVTYRFQRYPSAVEGAKDMVRIALRSSGARAAVAAGSVEDLAAAMFDAGYYTGVKGSREDRIAAYANMVRSGMVTLSRTGGVAPSGSAGVAGVVALVVGVSAAASLAWWVASS